MNTKTLPAPDGRLSDAAHAQRLDEIRRMALAAILTKDESFSAARYQKELRKLGSRESWLAFQEAIITLCVIRRVMPSRTVRRLKELREFRIKQNEEHLFEEFEKQLSDYLHPQLLTNHGYREHTFATLDHTQIWHDLRTYVDRLADFGYEVFLNSGTLLGVVRDQKFIDHDDDVDLAVILHAKTAKEAAVEWLELRQKLADADLFEEGLYEGPEIFKLPSIGETEIDLFPAWHADGKMYVFPHTTGNVAVEDVLPLKECAVSGLPLPKTPEPMLIANYGQNWQSPDPFFKFDWLRARKKFSGFLKELG